MAGGPRVALRSSDRSTSMTPERWREITEIFHAARECDPALREAFVAEACRDDPTLRREVEAMLVGHDGAGRFGETPLLASASRPEPASDPARACRDLGLATSYKETCISSEPTGASRCICSTR